MTRAEREREARKSEMLAAAEKVLCRKGYHEASMDEIARESKFTKRTLYQYFLNKEDLYFAVSLNAFRELGNLLEAASGGEGSGLDRLRGSVRAFLEFNKADPGRIKLFTLISQLSGPREGSPHYVEWQGVLKAITSRVAAIIEEGKADGSVRKGIDASRTSLSLIFLTTGFFNLLAINGRTFARHYGLDLEAFTLDTLELVAGSLSGDGAIGSRPK
jgi:AcrR family transcriptional regulator